jgi:TIR domain
VWLDELELRIGDSLVERIADAIAEGDFVLAIVSPDSLESKWCQQELSWAATRGIADKRVAVLPIRHRGAAMPPGLADRFWVDTGTQPIDSLVERIARDVERHRVGGEPAARLPQPSSSPAAPSFDCYGQVEKIDDVITLNDRTLRDNFRMWVNVRNEGSTSEFAARVWNVLGIPASWGPYAVRQPSWEGTSSSRVEIDGYGGERRIKLANVARMPRAFWFYTTQRGHEECAEQYLISELVPEATVVIGFELEWTASEMCRQVLLISSPFCGHRRRCLLVCGRG